MARVRATVLIDTSTDVDAADRRMSIAGTVQGGVSSVVLDGGGRRSLFHLSAPANRLHLRGLTIRSTAALALEGSLSFMVTHFFVYLRGYRSAG